MSIFKSLSYFVAFGMPVFLSCGKKSSAPPTTHPPVPKPACQIVGITDSSVLNGTYVYHLTYDDSGRLATDSTSGPDLTMSKTFTYSGDTAVVVFTNAHSAYYVDSISFNKDGLMTRDYFISSGSRELATFVYDDSGEVQSITRGFDNNNIGTENYYWSGGNMIRDTFFTYTYSNKPSLLGDYWYYTQQFGPARYYSTITGAIHVKTRNLLTAFSSSGGTTNITYSSDTTGKIISMALSVNQGSNVAEKISYQYQCK